MEMFEQGQGCDGEWSMGHAGCQGRNRKSANVAVIPAPQIFFLPQFNNKKVKAACITVFF